MISEKTSTKSGKKIACVNDLQKQPITKNKTKPLGSQRVGFKSGELEITWFKYFIMPSRMRKC
jgi:hypothetical protein